MRMRTIDQSFEYIRGLDPDTALSRRALRGMVTSGVIPSVRVGQKYLVALESIDAYLSGQTDPATTSGAIRPVGR